MASKRAQTMAKRAREQAVKERRDRKRARKAEAAAERAAGHETPPEPIGGEEELLAPVAPMPTHQQT
jgi:hypothetical protein